MMSRSSWNLLDISMCITKHFILLYLHFRVSQNTPRSRDRGVHLPNWASTIHNNLFFSVDLGAPLGKCPPLSHDLGVFWDTLLYFVVLDTSLTTWQEPKGFQIATDGSLFPLIPVDSFTSCHMRCCKKPLHELRQSGLDAMNPLFSINIISSP